MKTLALFLILMFTLSLSSLSAQDDPPKPEKWKDVTWHEVVLVDFQSGKLKRVNEILDLYEKAGENAGVKGPEFHWLMTGDYNAMVIWHLEEGPSALEWKRTADGIKWWGEFIKLAGSKEEAEKLSDEYSSLINKSTSYISMKEK